MKNIQKIFLCCTFERCKNNGYLTKKIYNFLIENNYNLVKDSKEADAIIITACGFNKAQEDFSEKIIRHYIKKYSGKMIIISGCLPAQRDKYSKMKELICINPTELNNFNNLFKRNTGIESIKLPHFLKFKNKLLRDEDIKFRDNYHIEISSGCTNNCNYCLIKKAKGEVISKPIDNIIKEFQEGLNKGYRDFIFISDDCGSYGVDLDVDFSQLINRIIRIPVDFKVRICYFEPGRFIKLFSRMKESFKTGKIDWINIPIQSGSNNIIKKMNRYYRIEDLLNVIEELRKVNPRIVIVTDVIFCFPGETRKDFYDSINIIDKFDQINFFCYSDREGTPAYYMGDKLDKSEKNFRISVIDDLKKSPNIFKMDS
jgi:MiaB/RimO family radical SAM methylthiotransferase